jgi:hypothetical protein
LKKLTLKTKTTSSTGGVFNFKGAYDMEKKLTSQEVKLQFPFNRFHLWMGMKATDLKVHVDLGEINVLKKLRFYSNARFSEKGDFLQARLGAVHDGKKC